MKTDKAMTVMILAEKMLKKKKQKRSRKQVEADARRKVANDWDKVAHGVRYRKSAAKEHCRLATLQMEDELFDGILLDLKAGRDGSMSYSRQKRVLRRIVEKRQAQQVHRKVGRSLNRLSSYVQRHCASQSMSTIRRYQMCA